MSVKSILPVYETSKGRLCIYWDEYCSKNFFHIRYWFKNKETGEYTPGRPGIGIPEENMVHVYAAIKKLMEPDNEPTAA